MAIAIGEYEGPPPPSWVSPIAKGISPRTVVPTVINTGRKRELHTLVDGVR